MLKIPFQAFKNRNYLICCLDIWNNNLRRKKELSHLKHREGDYSESRFYESLSESEDAAHLGFSVTVLFYITFTY